jgi:Cft2 family RNA processing exonuclease
MQHIKKHKNMKNQKNSSFDYYNNYNGNLSSGGGILIPGYPVSTRFQELIRKLRSSNDNSNE